MGDPSATTGSGVLGWPLGIGRGLPLGGGALPAPRNCSIAAGWRRGCLRSPGKRTGPMEGQTGVGPSPGWWGR